MGESLRILALKTNGDHEGHSDKVFYDPDFEAWACEECDVWLSLKCEDPQCAWCTLRPMKPSHKMTGP